MKRLLLIILCLLLAACSNASAAYEAKPVTPQSFPKTLSDATLGEMKSFSYQRALEVLKDDNNNFSPLSLYLAMAMVTEGSEKTTLTELKNYLNFKGSDTELSTLAAEIMGSLNVEGKGNKVLLANSLWARNDFPIKKTFADVLNNSYSADLYNVAAFNAETAKKMADWVDQKTLGLIKPEFDGDTFQADAVVLMNTLYFKSGWLTPFDESRIEKGPFTTADGSEVEKDYLRSDRIAGAFELKSGIGTYVPLLNGYRMTFVLPNEGSTPKDVLKELAEQTPEIHQMTVHLRLPKYSFKADYELTDSIKKLAPRAFSEAAEFTKLSDVPAYISAVKQQSFVELNELGVSAAAVTIVEMVTGAPMPEQNKEITIDLKRPFLFMIETEQGLPLFIGTLNK